MAGNRAAFSLHGEVSRHQRRQFPVDIVVHLVVLLPWGLCGIDVEPGAEAEIPGTLRVIRHVVAARAGIGADDGQPMLCRVALGTRLVDEVLIRAG